MRTLAAVWLALWLTLVVVACQPVRMDPQSVNDLQTASSQLTAEIASVRAQISTEPDPVKRAALEGQLTELERWSDKMSTVLDNVEEDGDVWGALGEMALWIGSGFFPPLVAGIPIFRTLRRQRNTIFRSIDAGGGPLNKERARRVLSSDVAAYKAFQAYKLKRDPSLFVGNDGAVL